MSSVTADKKVPDFTLPATGDQEVSLKQFKGKNRGLAVRGSSVSFGEFG